MGAQGEDVQLSHAARCKFPYSVEAKNQERLNIWSADEQAEQNAKEYVPLTIFKKDKTKAYVALPWNHFLSLIAPGPQTNEMTDSSSSTAIDKDSIRRTIDTLQSLLED